MARENWICDRIRSEFYQHNPDICTENISDADVVWVIAPWRFRKYELLRGKKSIFSIFHITPSKFNRSRITPVNKHGSAIHTICNKTKDFLLNYTNKDIHVEPFWVNQNIWTPLDKAKCRNELGLDQEAYIVGSFQRDTEGSDLKSPKLEKGPDQFCDIVESMHKKNKKVHVLLGGWRRQYILSRMKSAGIPCSYKERPSFDILNKMYNCLDLYIVSARHEGGPQSIPECAATKTPIISTDVGCSDIFLNQDSVYSFPDYEEAKPDCDFAYEEVLKKFIPNGFESFIDMFSKL